MQRSVPASSVVLLVRVQAPTGHQKQVKLVALEHVSPWVEDVHQPVRVALSVVQPREVLTTVPMAGSVLPVNGNDP